MQWPCPLVNGGLLSCCSNIGTNCRTNFYQFFVFTFGDAFFFFVVFIVVVICARKIIAEQRCAYQRVNILCRDFTVICGESEYNCKFNWRKLLSRQFVAYCISAVVQKNLKIF